MAYTEFYLIISYFFDIFISLSYTYYTVNESKSELFPITNNLSSSPRMVIGFGGTSKSSPRLMPTALRLYFSRKLESFKLDPTKNVGTLISMRLIFLDRNEG